MSRFFIVTYLVLGFCLSVSGQTEIDVFQQLEQRAPGDGIIEIKQDDGIADLVKILTSQNEKLTGIEGWRIQLFSGAGPNAKKEAQDVKGRAMTDFPDEKVYLIYNAPFWWVRIGDYRDKSESLQLYYQLKKKFLNCYPVKDETVQVKGLVN
jgi:hypothetical protein